MKCPDCQAPVREAVPTCPACGFSLDQIEGMGRMPSLKGVLTDAGRLLSRRHAGKIRTEIRRFVRRFPQLRFHTLITRVPSDVALQKFAFWVFNQGTLCSTLDKGGLNFQLLLVIDSDSGRSNLSIGYGLEPFVSEAHLQRILQAGEEALGLEAYGEATLAILEEATEVLHEIGDAIPKTYGMRAKVQSTEF